MAFEEEGERIKDLELILQKVAFAATLFDEDGYVSLPLHFATAYKTSQRRHLLHD